MPAFYVNKTKFKPLKQQCKKVTLSTIPYIHVHVNICTSSNLLHLVHLLYTKMCIFAHMINAGSVTFPWHVKNLIVFYR